MLSTNLSQFANKNVFIICEDGSSIEGFLERYDGFNHIYSLLYEGKEIAYTSDGFHLSNKSPHPLNIMSIDLADQIPESVQLEQKVKEMQKELEALNAKVEEARLQERLEERKGNSKLPRSFRREDAIRFLETPLPGLLSGSFHWKDTPQGFNYWNRVFEDASWEISYGNGYKSYVIPEKARYQIMEWVVESYKQDFGY